MTITSRKKAVNTRQTRQLVGSSNPLLIENYQVVNWLIGLNSDEDGVKIGQKFSLLSSYQASCCNCGNTDSVMLPLPSAKAAHRADKKDDNFQKAKLNHELLVILRQASDLFSEGSARGFSEVIEGCLWN
ncbi:hypothetical protein NIES2100_40590 [Calothrix sp. NIES-2100]|uniref:hypothetical protein n=1 Tax=Calothrix sp. NIES-2100 TaxID=1954172 RepID=UPI000B5F735E|nr:hypothetical protein NIES2100_40590 [Calothrix sp. NIES-2100]